ncbi:MAG: hypothetical protein JSS31_03960 [Proteobacteria bacterium]|nr:hypothetical protein [Pseudomonadota bacterium]MBS0493102.1 hypothetical protein [Pseudomonadota bacterium]
MLKLFLWTLRDMADQDYVAARAAWWARLYPSYFWSASQALEKYLKCISALSGLQKPSVIGHKLTPLVAYLEQSLLLKPDFSKTTKSFLSDLDECAPYRYGQMSWDTLQLSILYLDYAVWDIRRYAQPLVDAYSPDSGLSDDEWEDRARKTMQQRATVIAHAGQAPIAPFHIAGGWLESVLNDQKHPARAILVRNNPGFGLRKRKVVRVYPDWAARNSPLLWFPELIDEYCRYVHLERDVLAGYRELAAKGDQPVS